MDYQVLANLLFPNVTDTPEDTICRLRSQRDIWQEKVRQNTNTGDIKLC